MFKSSRGVSRPPTCRTAASCVNTSGAPFPNDSSVAPATAGGRRRYSAMSSSAGQKKRSAAVRRNPKEMARASSSRRMEAQRLGASSHGVVKIGVSNPSRGDAMGAANSCANAGYAVTIVDIDGQAACLPQYVLHGAINAAAAYAAQACAPCEIYECSPFRREPTFMNFKISCYSSLRPAITRVLSDVRATIYC